MAGGWVVCCPRIRIGSSHFMLSSLPFRLCVAVFVVGGEVRWCAVVCGGRTVSRSVLLLSLVFAVTALLV